MHVFNGEPWGEAWSSDKASTYLQDLFATPRSAGVVAEADSCVIGFVLGRAEQRDQNVQFYLSEMCVLAEYQG